jgi:hypothetical protein
MKFLIIIMAMFFSINSFAFEGAQVAAIFSDARFKAMQFESIEYVKEERSFNENGYAHTSFMVKVNKTTCIPVTVTSVSGAAGPEYIVSSSSIITNCTSY